RVFRNGSTRRRHSATRAAAYVRPTSNSGRKRRLLRGRPQSSSATLGVGSVYVRQHDASEYLGRSRVLQNLTGPPVELILHRLDVVVTDRLIEPSPLRKIVTDKPVRVLIRRSLPRRMRVTEVHPAIRGHGDPGVLGHLLALVPRQCLEQRLRQR